jgi:colicin import membrane protein
MSATLAGPFLEWRREEALAPALVLAIVVHLLLAVLLTFGVRWQSRAPDVVQVELWQPPPPPPPVVQPEPPKPAPVVQPKPEPRIEKPDIAIKEPAKPKPKPEAKPKPEPKAKPEAKAKPKPAAKPDDAALRRLLAEAVQREQQQFAAERERQAIKDQLARDAANARFKGIAAWVDKIRAKIRGNIVLPPDLQGNPEALFLVTQLPTGEVLQARLVISSGHAGYDEAVLRAILKSSPLPKPDSPGLFERELKLTFRPRD